MKIKKYTPSKRKPIRDLHFKKNFSGEQSPYWQYMASVTAKRAEGTNDVLEDPLANPDVLSEEDSLYNRPLTEVGELQKQAVEETINKLSARERMVFDLCADQGMTEQATAEQMGITRRAVQTFLTRIRMKMKRRFEQLLLEEK